MLLLKIVTAVKPHLFLMAIVLHKLPLLRYTRMHFYTASNKIIFCPSISGLLAYNTNSEIADRFIESDNYLKKETWQKQE